MENKDKEIYKGVECINYTSLIGAGLGIKSYWVLYNQCTRENNEPQARIWATRYEFARKKLIKLGADPSEFPEGLEGKVI